MNFHHHSCKNSIRGLLASLCLVSSACSQSVKPTHGDAPPPVPSDAKTFDFEDGFVGKTPPLFTAGLTGGGGPVRWEIQEATGAPSGGKVVTQLSNDRTNTRYPILIRDDVSATDVDVSIRFKTLSGEVDASGGIVFRYRDTGNYYVVRANALEGNVVAYKTENGKRSSIGMKGKGKAYGVDVEVPHKQWNTLERVIPRCFRWDWRLRTMLLKRKSNAPILLIALGALVLGFMGCQKSSKTSEGEVVAYTSVDDVFARPVAERFQSETGIIVKLVPDTGETKSTGLLNRLMAEQNRPVADVFWSGDPVRAAILKAKGISLHYHSPNAVGMAPGFSDPEGNWSALSDRTQRRGVDRKITESHQRKEVY